MLLHGVLGDGIPDLMLSFPFMPHDTADFPFFQMKAAASLKFYFLIPGGTHTREMNGNLKLRNTSKFPHYPFRLYRWKHFGVQERFQEKGFPGKQALFQGKLNWKPVISVNRQLQDSYFVSAGWTDPAVEHYSRFPAWVQLAIAARFPELSRRYLCGVLKWTPQSCRLWQQPGLVRGISQGTESVPLRISN